MKRAIAVESVILRALDAVVVQMPNRRVFGGPVPRLFTLGSPEFGPVLGSPALPRLPFPTLSGTT